MEIKKSAEDFVVKEQLKIDNKPGNFVYLLEKKNYNTANVVDMLENKFSCKIKFCGNKDKKAITFQYISCKKKIPEVNILKENSHIKTSFIGTNSEPLSLGSHEKNYFEIRVYGIERGKFRKEKFSFPNYFGEQRFSEKNVIIGELLLERKYDEAIKLIDNKLSNDYLTKRPNDYVGALKKVPKKIIRLYLAAVQSKEFNMELSNNVKGINLYVSNQNLRFPEEEFITDKDVLMKGWASGDRRFLFKEYPEISLEGEKRNSAVLAEEIEFDGKLIKFFLPKGSYATIFLRSIFLENIKY